MDNFIVFYHDGAVLHGSGYTPLLRRHVKEGRVKELIDISNPTEPKKMVGDYAYWDKMHVVG